MNKQQASVLAVVLIGLGVLAGCRERVVQPGVVVEIPAGSFAQGWRATLPLKAESVSEIQLLGETLLVYTSNNRVFGISAAGGQLRWADQVAKPSDSLKSAIQVKDQIVFPTSATLEIYNDRGQRQRSASLGHAIRSDGAAVDEFVYIGLDYEHGGRLAKVDATRLYAPIRWEVMTRGGLSARPVWKDQSLYFASEDGLVYAVNEDRSPIWATPGNVFTTGGRIVADLAVDDYAVYVASTDTRLYALDRTTAKIRWQFYAGTPLLEAPTLTADSVYQFVPRMGLVALDKTEGAFAREPRWVVTNARRVLSSDDKYVYALTTDRRVAALDKVTGEPKFTTTRTDLSAFAYNPASNTIYAATKDGEVISINPALTPGGVGEVVRGTMEAEMVVLGR